MGPAPQSSERQPETPKRRQDLLRLRLAQDLSEQASRVHGEGQSLTRLVKEDCPEGLSPALLLTIRDDVEEDAVVTDSEYIVIVRVARYLREAKPDAASSYYARSFGSGITGLKHLHDVASNPNDLGVRHRNARAAPVKTSVSRLGDDLSTALVDAVISVSDTGVPATRLSRSA